MRVGGGKLLSDQAIVQASKLEVSRFRLSLCPTFLIELSSYSKSRLTGDTYLRKTKSLLDHFKPSLARDRLFVIVIFVHSLQDG